MIIKTSTAHFSLEASLALYRNVSGIESCEILAIQKIIIAHAKSFQLAILGSCVVELFRICFIIITLSLNYPMVTTMVKCIVREWSYWLYLDTMYNSDYDMVVVKMEIQLDSLCIIVIKYMSKYIMSRCQMYPIVFRGVIPWGVK